MHTVNPGLLGSAASFKRRFAGPIEREHDPEATARLQRIVTPFLLRRLKSDRSIIDDLPDKVEQTQHCPLTREQATLYQAVVDDLIEKTEDLAGIRPPGCRTRRDHEAEAGVQPSCALRQGRVHNGRPIGQVGTTAGGTRQ